MSHHHKPEQRKNWQLEELIELEKAELRSLREIANELKPKPITAEIANRFSGESSMANNALVFNVGQTSVDTVTPLLADGITPSGGVLSNVSVAFNDPSATAVLNPDNTITFTGVADSAGIAVGGTTTATVTVFDSHAVIKFPNGRCAGFSGEETNVLWRSDCPAHKD